MHRPFLYAVNRLSPNVTQTLVLNVLRETAPLPTRRRQHEACKPPRNGRTHHIRRPSQDDFL